MRRLHVVWLALVVLMVPSGAALAGGPFAVRVVDPVESTVLGLAVTARVEIRNVSGREQAFPFFGQGVRVEVVDAPRSASSLLESEGETATSRWARFVKEKKQVVPPDWRVGIQLGFRPPLVGEYAYRVVVRFPDTGKLARLAGEHPNHWVGTIATRPIRVRVVEPQGVDAEAFRAILALGTTNARESEPARFWRALAFEPGAGKLLMTRYVESIYAASVIHRKYAGGWLRAGPERVFSVFDRGFESQKGRLRCRKDASADTLTFEERYFVGPEYVMCRDSWLEIALENHPEAWFADEIRWKLALDRYLLGDPAACAAGLEALAEHGRADVAVKARDLLSAMRAKGMLPGEGTE